MKKQFKAVLSLLLAGCFCGCTQPEVQKQADEPMVLTFSFWEPGMAHELEDALQKVADGYEALHPEVEIQLISQPVETYQDWIKTRLVADDLPDIESNHNNDLQSQYRAGLLVDITDMLNAESPYANGQIWKDTFLEAHLGEQETYYGIPFFGLSLGIYYNKAIYEALNLQEPKTWREFLDNCEVIQNAGKLPIAMMAQKDDACSWIRWYIAGGLFAKRHINDLQINTDGNQEVSATEANLAYLNGYINIATDAEYQEEYRQVIRRMEEYLAYCGGYPGYEESVAKAMFLSGEAAHIHTGSWDVKGLMMNEGTDFEVGVFKFPAFTEAESPYAGRTDNLSEQSVGITRTVYSEEGKLKAAIDFLQYFTSKEVHQSFINDTAHMPVIRDVAFVEGTEAFCADGTGIDELLLRGEGHVDMIHQILSGEVPELDQAFFEKKQAQAMHDAQAAVRAKEANAQTDGGSEHGE